MEKWTLLRVIEACITQNWEDLCPCEVFPELDFPDHDCEGDCGRCLLNAIRKENADEYSENGWLKNC
jgi:hypothetical protein